MWKKVIGAGVECWNHGDRVHSRIGLPMSQLHWDTTEAQHDYKATYQMVCPGY